MLPLVALVLAAAPVIVTVGASEIRVADKPRAVAVSADAGYLNIPEVEESLRALRPRGDAGSGFDVELRVEPAVRLAILKRAMFSAASAGARTITIKVGDRGPFRTTQSPGALDAAPARLTVRLGASTALVFLGGADAGVAGGGADFLGDARKSLAKLKAGLPAQRAVWLEVSDDVTATLLADAFAMLTTVGLDEIALLPADAAGGNWGMPGAPGERLGSLDKEHIRGVIHSKRAEVRACYEKVLARTAGVHGKVSVKFVISAQGSVARAEIADSEAKNAELEGCIVAAVKGFQFDKPIGGGVVMVTYPFVFSEGADAGAPKSGH